MTVAEFMTPFLLPEKHGIVFWLIAAFRMSNAEMRLLLGEPHYTETDSYRTYGGDEDHWIYTLDSGQHIGVVSLIPYGIIHLLSDEPDLKEAIGELKLPADLVADKARFEVVDPPRKGG